MRVHRLQDGRGDLLASALGRTLLHYESTNVTPTNAASGYETGAIWVNGGGTPGTILYINVGTNTSATWQNIV